MKKYLVVAVILIAAIVGWKWMAHWRVNASVKPSPLVTIDKQLERRTVVKKSLIPGAGDGLFAVAPIKRGEVIGHLGGRLLVQFPKGNHYVGALPDCARNAVPPYRYIDSKEHGANASRINFAPRRINGIDTHFQNAAIRRLCKSPYFEFVALQDISVGEEIWSSYGDNYDYDRFMRLGAVRDFFCAKVKTDCREKYSYEP